MHSLPLSIGVCVALLFSVSLRGGERPRRAQGDQNFSQKVWTNSDIDVLRERGLISIIGPEVAPPTTQAAAPAPVAPAAVTPAPGTTVRPVYNSRLDDPEWYAENAALLRAELARREALVREEEVAIALAARGITQPGIALDKPSYGVTPQEALAYLQTRAAEMQGLLDELNDMARAHNISPGVFRAVEASQDLGF